MLIIILLLRICFVGNLHVYFISGGIKSQIFFSYPEKDAHSALTWSVPYTTNSSVKRQIPNHHLEFVSLFPGDIRGSRVHDNNPQGITINKNSKPWIVFWLNFFTISAVFLIGWFSRLMNVKVVIFSQIWYEFDVMIPLYIFWNKVINSIWNIGNLILFPYHSSK